MERKDDFQERRKHLANLSEKELEEKFWQLSEKIVNPIVDLASKTTSPSIERSVLLRMGFSSLEAKSIVEGAIDRGLIGKGAGHIVFKLAKEKNMDIREAGLNLAEDKLWDDAISLFGGGKYEAKGK